nr:hypothetical protein [Candidatus Sigynarchaeota archaeon]
MNRLKPIELDRTRGYPFAMVFAFLPEGTKLLTGSVDLIRKYLSDKPTCHGVVNLFGSDKQKFRYIKLFGMNANFTRHSIYFYVNHYTNVKHLTPQDTSEYVVQYLYASRFIGSRIKYILTVRLVTNEDIHGKTYILGAWRTMPSRYLDEFRLFDSSNPFGICMDDIRAGKYLPWKEIRAKQTEEIKSGTL